MSMCPHARRSGPIGHPNRRFSPRLASPSPLPDANPPVGLPIRRGVLLWCSNGPAAESGERYLGNVGLTWISQIDSVVGRTVMCLAA